MYPVTNCGQVLDSHIIEEIRKLYSVPSAADLVLEKATANKTGRYLSFQTVVANYGLKNVQNSTLKVIVKNSVIKEFDTEGLEIGTKKSWTVRDLRIPGDTKQISFVVETDEEEITESNNAADIRVVEA